MEPILGSQAGHYVMVPYHHKGLADHWQHCHNVTLAVWEKGFGVFI